MALPLILAGPIIRRAEPDAVWVWIATSLPVVGITPTLVAFDTKRSPSRRNGYAHRSIDLKPPPLMTPSRSDFRTFPLGKRLYVSLRALRPARGRFPVDTLLGYDLKIALQQAGATVTTTLSGLGKAIAYPRLSLPSFYLAGRPRLIAQASCRRPDGPGKDASETLDGEMWTHAANLDKRPASLFLTGDQIYADDVAAPLFAAVRALAVDIMGYDEYLPDTWRPGASGQQREVRARDIKGVEIGGKWVRGTRRGSLLAHGFTTQDGERHLMSFGELAAMYLLVWNDQLGKKYAIKPGRDKHLRGFDKAVASMRRILANVPTYMTFDDHEITDDWNIDAVWKRKTQSGKRATCARRVIANGLAAYWAFQGWGNDPDEPSSHGLGGVVAGHLKKLALRAGRNYASHDRDFAANVLGYQKWSYRAPSDPAVLVPDLRTQRHYKRGRSRYSSLIDKRGMDRLVALGKKNRKPWSPLVIVSATPLLPWDPLLTVRKLALWKSRYDKEEGDLWDDTPRGRQALIGQLARKLHATALISMSGDVHFSHVTVGHSQGGGWSLPVAQITSSALKNEATPLSKRRLGISQAALLGAGQKIAVARRKLSFRGPHSVMPWALGNIEPNSLTWRSATISGARWGMGEVIPVNQACLLEFVRGLVSSMVVRARYIGPRVKARVAVPLR